MILLRRLCPIAILALMLTSCARHNEAAWTILVYMAADNGLSENADLDIEQMEFAERDLGVQVIVEIDRDEYSADPTAHRYEIRRDPAAGIGSETVGDLGEINSADPASLTSFIRWGVKNYPADRYALVIWSHGSGWYRDSSRSTCDDDVVPNGGDATMRLSDGSFRQALAASGAHFDALVFDACLMQTMEAIGETQGIADYVIGSEDLTPVAGFPYQDILTLFSLGKPTALTVAAFPRIFVDSHLPGGSQYAGGTTKLSCSVADVSQYQNWLDACAGFVSQWGGSADSLRGEVDRCEKLGLGDDNIDPYEFFILGSTGSHAPALHEALTMMFETTAALFPARVTATHDGHEVGAASMWFPQSPEALENWIDGYGSFRFAASRWTDFLSAYYEE
jgi:hypothetical protein